ncbi:hypothetical protein MAR_009659 [Mya arenaria]|uniref:Uncharacterized protein n=1 Tax=Mya arenaria TaxID=6604 RepID=A0ABY7E7J6_MYAAR|nr:uncharacterized protein LOC128231520 [Mya arenaria]WAR03101.1 hypothetical protein MAR_009659 [Mya arenaria]
MDIELPVEQVQQRQNTFITAFKSCFLNKISKYQNILMKNGVQISQHLSDVPAAVAYSPSFEDHIELVIGQKSGTVDLSKSLWKRGGRISTLQVFTWIYDLVRRTKAVRILRHLDGVPEDDVHAVLDQVGAEMAVAYEYQLVMLAGNCEVVRLAQHATACMLEFLNSTDGHFNPEDLLQAVLAVKPKSGRKKEILRTRAVIFRGNTVCFCWRLGQVLKQPGLRMVHNFVNAEMKHNDDDITKENISAANSSQNSVANENINDESSGICLKERLGKAKSYNKDTSSDNCTALSVNSCSVEKSDSILTLGDTGNTMPSMEESPVRLSRVIQAVNMDYEKGILMVTDHHVEASDFSPVDHSDSLLEDKTSLDGDSDNFSEHEKPDNKMQYLNREVKEDNTHAPNKNECKIDIHRDKSYADFTVTDQETRNMLKTQCNNENIIQTSQTEFNKEKMSLDLKNPDCSLTNESLSHSVNTADNDLRDVNFTHINVGATVEERAEPNQRDFNTSICQHRNTLYKFYGCFTPYGAKCRPNLYGFRGPLHVWNYRKKKYSLIYNDSVSVASLHNTEMPVDDENAHQSYSPKTICEH